VRASAALIPDRNESYRSDASAAASWNVHAWSTVRSNCTKHLAQMPYDTFMKGAEWSAPATLKRPA
jgi:hypothetical protein